MSTTRNGALLFEDEDRIGIIGQGKEATFSIWILDDTDDAARLELAATNFVGGRDVELSCGGCESHPWVPTNPIGGPLPVRFRPRPSRWTGARAG